MVSAEQLMADTERYSVHNYKRLPFVAERGKGVWVYDTRGRAYMDLLVTYGANSLGHNHPRIVRAMCEYLREGYVSSMSGGFYNPPYAKLVKALANFCGKDKVILKSGGSEAFEVAVKIAKRWGYQEKGIKSDCAEVISAVNCFHGRLPYAIATSSNPEYKKDFGPFPPGIRQVVFNDPDALERVINENTACFVVEAIQGEGGIHVADDGYLRECLRICRKNNVLLIVDEIQTGLGRTGYKFAYQHDDIEPDMIIMAKTLGGGLMPVSAVAANDNIMNLIHPGDEGSTFGSHPLSCVVALEVLLTLEEENLIKNARKIGNYFKSKIMGLNSPLIQEVRGRGLMVGVELVSGAKEPKFFCERLLQEGIICEKAGKNVVRFSPPLIINEGDVDWAVRRINRVFGNLEKGN